MSDTPTTFDRLRAIVKGGHLAGMSGAEAKALLAYYVYADFTTGEAYPSMETIAAHCGVTNVHRARAAVKRLDARGVLAVVRPSNGYNPTVRRIECPSTLPVENRAGNRTGTENVPDGFRRRTGTVLEENRDGFGAHTGTETGPLTNKNTPKNKSKNKSTRRFSDAEIESVYQAYPRKEAKPPALREIGKALTRIADRANAPTDPVAWLIGRVQAYAAKGLEKKYTKLPAGWFRDGRFDDDLAPDQGGFNIDFEEPSAEALATLGDGDKVERTADGFLATRPSRATLDKLWGRSPQTNSKGEFQENVNVSDLVIDTRSK